MDLYRSYKHLKIYLQFKFLFFIMLLPLKNVVCQITYNINNIDDNFNVTQRDYMIGPCLVSMNKTCPDEEVTFFLYTREYPEDGHQIFVNDTRSNLEHLNPHVPTKFIVHGYNSNMQLDSLVNIKNEYLKKYKCNVIAVDWHRLAIAPCYPFAVYNALHVGKCLAQLINRVRETGAKDLHVVGFSLGAHVPAFAANELRPYKISRITGLDPAMPFFITFNNDEKLDPDDAEFVDVYHTNAFVQGKIESCGHIDFYMNGGIRQPGCWGERNPFGCDHHRAPEYFAESINSKVGFWGWPCTGFFQYLVGYCPPKLPAVLAGDDVDRKSRGFYLVTTNTKSPFANGSIILDDYWRNDEKTGFKKKVKHFKLLK